MKITYIFHVIGTLTMDHVSMALESLRKQDPFHWHRFVLYNGSDLPSGEILALVDKSRFDKIEEFEYDPFMPKSCSADWQTQMYNIVGSDRYLCHKADFYMPPWTCATFENLPEGKDFIVLFNKFDMKSRATPDDIRRFAGLDWFKALREPDVGSYSNHLHKMAIPFEQLPGQADGVMHGYTDRVRALYKVDDVEYEQRWGVAVSFRMLEARRPLLFVRDPRFFAVHMYHESPDRTDANKNMSPEERF